MSPEFIIKLASDWALWILGGFATLAAAWYVATRTSLKNALAGVASKAGEAMSAANSTDRAAREQISRVERRLSDKIDKLGDGVRDEISDLETAMNGRFDSFGQTLNDHEGRIIRAEEFLKHAPTNEGLLALERRVGALSGRIEGVERELKGVGGTVTMIHQHLLDRSGNGGGNG